MTLQLRSNTTKGTANPGFRISKSKRRRRFALHRTVKQASNFVRLRYTLLPGGDMVDQPIGGMIKRSLDVAIAASALITLFPLFALIAFLVKVSDGGPVLYRHIRLGHSRRSFPCLKFRTMVPNADNVLLDYLRRSEAAANEWAATRKLKSDPRITPVGAALRKLSIDELPQLINVLRGEMSVVGPRPIVFDEIPMYGQDIDFYFCARPGLTGAWQVSGRSNESYARRVSLDRRYVENWSLWTDLRIVVKTIPAVLATRDAY
jgi:exopolysaccharide production protein ExoY